METVTGLEAEKGIEGFYLVFWIHNIPFGRLEVSTKRLPMSGVDVRLNALWVIMPALRQMAPAEMLDTWPFNSYDLSQRDLNFAFREIAAMLPRRRPPDRSQRVSVVICTRNRTDEIRKCLTSLMRQSQPPHEIIVVDNAPQSNATHDILGQFPRVRYVMEPRPGLDWARNAGVRNSRGDIIAFTDDDVTVHEDWIARISESFQDPKVTAVTGLVLPEQLRTFSQVYFERYWPLGKGFITRRFSPAFLAGIRHGVAPVWEIGAGANMAFRQQVFIKFGEFDERLDVGAAGCSGDSEFWYRILAGGGYCLYNPAAVVFHRHRVEMKALRRQIYGYMKGHVTALFIQYEKFGNRGNLCWLLGGLPKYYLQRLGRCLWCKSSHKDRLLVYEILGYMAGFLFYFYHTKIKG